MVFIDDDSLEEVASYKLTMGKLYIALSSMFVAIVLITVTIMLLTPMRYYIPGYGSEAARMQTIKLKHTVDSLTDLVGAQQRYEENIRRVITGEAGKEPDTTMLDMRSVRQGDKNSMLPNTDQIKKTAMESIKAEERKNKKAGKR